MLWGGHVAVQLHQALHQRIGVRACNAKHQARHTVGIVIEDNSNRQAASAAAHGGIIASSYHWRRMMATLQELKRVRSELGLVPVDHLIFLGLGIALPKRNAIELDPQCLPAQPECNAVAGLDVMLLYRGDTTRYGTLRTLADRLVRATPRRLQLIDVDRGRVAYLKLATTHA